MVKHQSETFFKKIGSLIATLREEQGLTQNQLAEKIGVKQPVLASYEIGRRRIPLPRLVQIAEALSVYLEELIPDLTRRKHGPSSKLDRELARVRLLNKADQEHVIELIQTVTKRNRAS
jgi:transcriptional regulator with XRE-family HTH domain